MPGQVIGTVNVQVGGTTSPRVNTLSYGGKNQIATATDLSLVGAQDGDVIVYQANTNSFIVEPAEAVLGYLDGGSF